MFEVIPIAKALALLGSAYDPDKTGYQIRIGGTFLDVQLFPKSGLAEVESPDYVDLDRLVARARFSGTKLVASYY
jgi:hypothetical protein